MPPLREQQAIAAALADADALIAAVDRLAAKKRAVTRAAMQQLLTGRTRLPGFTGEWATRRLGELIAPLESGVSVRSVTGLKTIDVSQPSVLKTSAVYGGEFDPTQLKPVEPADWHRVRLNPRADTILMSRMNTIDLVGECGYVFATLHNAYLPDRLWMISSQNRNILDMKWLNYILSDDAVRQYIKDAATGTSGSMKNIAHSTLLNISVTLPPLPEQQAIAAVLSDMDAEVRAVEAERDKARHLKRGMMQELLTGRTRLL